MGNSLGCERVQVIGKDISSFRECIDLLFRLLAVKEGVAVNTVMNFKFI